MSVSFLTSSNWVALSGLILGTVLVLRHCTAEGMAMITGSFALLRLDNGKDQ